MKRFFYTFLLLSFASSLIRCNEIGPAINKSGGPDTSTAQKKVVLIEFETGDQCTNCPGGDTLAKRLDSLIYPGQVDVIELHDNYLSYPYVFSPQNLQSPDAAAIDNMLGPASVKPSASIDRVMFAGQTSYFVADQLWAGYVGSRVIDTPKVNIFITSGYDSSTRKVTVTVKVKYMTDVATLNNLNIALTEDKIIDPQLNNGVMDTFYVHNNVLRKMLTSTSGDPISGTLSTGYEFTSIQYTYTLPALFNANNCYITAFVTNATSSDIEIFQAQKIKMK